jgi:hypothetical protein
MNITRVRIASVLGCTVAVSLCCAAHAAAQNVPRVGIVLEAAGVWSNRNDVRIPPEGGTEFSIVDLIGTGPGGAARLEATVELNDRHGLRFTYAPLRISGSGIPDAPILFAGGLFSTLQTDAEYQFNSYRATYRYRFYNGDTWRWKVGFTGFVRDARIALEQPGTSAEDTDVGFVPLGHLSGEARLAERWGLLLELDGSAAPQGRAFDVLAVVEYRPSPRWTLGAGYRTIEGGADVDEVYTFAWLNAAVVRVRLSIGPRGR